MRQRVHARLQRRQRLHDAASRRGVGDRDPHRLCARHRHQAMGDAIPDRFQRNRDAGRLHRPDPRGRGRGAHRWRILQRAPRGPGHAGLVRCSHVRPAHPCANRPHRRALPPCCGEELGVNAVTVRPNTGVLVVARDYLSLLKLRIVALLDATAIGVMIPAAHGHPRLASVLAVLVGGTFAAGGAHAINCWFDRDIDAEMSRTRRRPLPDGRIPPWHALAIGIALVALAFTVLWAWANLLAAALALAGALIYVFVYTIWLKRATPQNIVIGGAAGAMPPLVGWAAATGSVDVTALALFGVIFFWTPPHFWALAQLIKSDYARAHVPMLPVVAGEQSAKRQSIVYAALTVAASVIPFFTGSAGAIYLAGAIVLGVGLVGISLLDLEGRRWTRRLWTYSMVYVALLFAVFAVSPFIP